MTTRRDTKATFRSTKLTIRFQCEADRQVELARLDRLVEHFRTRKSYSHALKLAKARRRLVSGIVIGAPVPF